MEFELFEHKKKMSDDTSFGWTNRFIGCRFIEISFNFEGKLSSNGVSVIEGETQLTEIPY